ncbi:hypothetical protein [Alkalicoccobacillus porphyridii]|uniref:Uncharacterized protein n=1 Tax=Alkalicoccobacillus porphyridii TaxID=2597270 RepID=A0A554A0X9_9BACI|nr:hypothetical protein [Alkalicoccobacillus porphyridii]TSB47352.1 hypothetical protein FN960_06330 [Alkalicoccobacillus porphyridii]
MDKWFLFGLCLVFLLGCQSKTDEAEAYEENGELLNEEKAEILERFGEPRPETSERPAASPDDSIVIEMEQDEMLHELQVPTGRYAIADGGWMIEGGEGSAGNVYIHSEEGELLFHDTLYGPFYSTYVIAMTLEETDTVSFDGLQALVLQPLATEYTSELFSGVWEVGLDIEPGTYQITPNVAGIANLELFTAGAEPRVFEIIGLEAEGQEQMDEMPEDTVEATSVTLTFGEGDTLRVTGMARISLERVEDG